MATTTNLVDLPTDTITGPNNNPVHMQTTEINQNVVVPNPGQELKIQRDNDTKNLNEFVTGIQQANTAGVLDLPSRDMPQDQSPITQDEQIKPNYIPGVENRTYIEDNVRKNEIIKADNNYQQSIINTDMLFEQYRIPIILGVLYFAFQTPTINMLLNKYAPSLFINDGNFNFMGNIILSILYASAYLCVDNIITYLSE